MPRVLCQGKVCWCQQVERKRYMIGVEFINLPPQIEQELEDFEKLLLARERSDIQQKTSMGTVPLSDAEVYQGDSEARSLTINNFPGSPPPPPPSQGSPVG